MASRGDAAYVGCSGSGHEVREVRAGARNGSGRGGIVEVHTGVHRARSHGRCEGAADVLSSSAAYGDCALTDCDRARTGTRMGCPLAAAHVWRRPHEVAVGREVVPHEDGSRCSGEQGGQE